MSEIKFRAWNKKDSMMYDVYTIEFCNGGIKVDGTGVHIGNGWATEDNGFKHDCDVVLMQFTGLTDKNGQDIYEGDIVKAIYENYIATFGSFGAGLVTSDGHSYWGGDYEIGSFAETWEWDKFEVIGNIHMHPELMESDNE